MKHEIEIEGLPEGWRAVAWRRLKNGDHYLNDKGEIVRNEALIIFALIVEKIKPRRIVLEETDEVRCPTYGEYFRKGLVDSKIELCTSHNYEYAVRIWTVVEEVESSSTTFRERVINDLVHNRIISEGG